MLPSILQASQIREPTKMAQAAERMSRVDTAWLRMDNDVNLMTIIGVWLIEPGISYEALCERVATKLLKYGRFRQKVVEDAMGASWVDDPAFDLRSVVTFTLTPTSTGTHLHMEQSGFRPDQKQANAGAIAGWHKFLANLDEVLARLD